MTVALVGAGGERHVLTVLDRARLLQIRGNGLLITGIETIKADDYPQTWWYVPYVRTRSDEPEPAKASTKLGDLVGEQLFEL